MQFVSAPNDPATMMKDRLVSENELVEIGVFRVMYGYRVRAGFVGQPWCEIDWCCGDRPNHILSMYTAIFLLLRRRPESRDCFCGIPRESDIKPYWKDLDFCQEITNLLLKQPDIVEARKVHL